MAELSANRPWIYPQKWPGWSDHIRVGGGLFDDASTLLDVLQHCWHHYTTHTSAQLSPQAALSIALREDIWPHWHQHLDYLKKHFQPKINNERLTFTFQLYKADDAVLQLDDPRGFAFVLQHPLRQELKCCFYLGQERIGSVSLGEINLRGDRCKLAVHRRFGMTRSSTIQKCYKNSPLHPMIPKKMLEDLRYLGWTFHFSQPKGQPQLTFKDVHNVGYLEGGEFLLSEHITLPLGEPLDFYQGERDGLPDDELRCRMLIIPEDATPEAPILQDLELFLHEAPDQPTLLEVKAWVHGVALQDDQFSLVLEDTPHTIQCRQGQTLSPHLHLFHTILEGVEDLRPNQTLRCIPEGENKYGLPFAEHDIRTHTLRQAVNPQFLGPTLLQKSQLERAWELRIALQGEAPYPEFALNDFTLWLQADQHPPVQIPLASVTQNTLLFRFLPRSVHMQLPLETLQNCEYLSLSLEQHRDDETPFPSNTWLISGRTQRPHTPLARLKLIDFDHVSRILPTEQTVIFPSHEEIVVEGHRIQLHRAEDTALPTTSPDGQVLLLEPKGGRRRIQLVYRYPGWMHASSRHNTAHSQRSRDIRALWLSCSTQDQWIDSPKERNPEGGPILAFGLGVGQTQEMAQIRPTAEGFRLYRHRQHIQVIADGVSLPCEAHDRARGHLLSPEQKRGWLLIDHILLRYEYGIDFQLDLTMYGLLLPNDSQHKNVVFTTGQDAPLPPNPHLPHIHISDEGRPCQLIVSGLTKPPKELLPRLLLQENRMDSPLPEELALGKTLKRGPLHLTVWEAQFREAFPDSLPQGHTLLLELNKKYARKRYFLSTMSGQLGHWSKGSAFLPSNGPLRPMFAPQHPRTYQGKDIPAGELVVGTQLTQSDLLVPDFFKLSSPQLFSLAARENTLQLRPLTEDIALVHLHPHQDGRIQFAEEPIKTPRLLSFSTSKRLHVRIGHLLFELSAHQDDCDELHQTDYLLSIRGTLHPANTAFVIGGPPHHTPLPLLDAIPQQSPEEPLFTVYSPDLQLRYKGDGVVGLQRPKTLSSLLDQLRNELSMSNTPQLTTTPLDTLYALHPEHQSTDQHVTMPPTLEEMGVTLHEHILTSASQLHFDKHTAQYKQRPVDATSPTYTECPARLVLSPPPTITIELSKEADGFLHPNGELIEQLFFGRWDPERPEEQLDEDAYIGVSEPFTEQDIQSAKLSFHGYSPRRAASITRFQNKLMLEIPAPRTPGGYHIVLEGEPCFEARTVLIDRPLRLHMNHLIECIIQPEDTRLHFVLQGFLLAHQQSSMLPVTLTRSNRLGHIHLRGLQPTQSLQLTPTQLPPHIAQLTTSTRRLGPFEVAPHEHAVLVDPTSMAMYQPPATDRLLWFTQTEAHTPFTWTPETEPAESLPDLSQDEGSSFGFFTSSTPPPSSMTSPADEGSSFAFGPTNNMTQEILSEDIVSSKPLTTPPRPSQTSTFASSGTEELASPLHEDPHSDTPTMEGMTPPHSLPTGQTEELATTSQALLQVGFFSPTQGDEVSEHMFGYVSDEDGVQLHIKQTLEGYLARPASYNAEPDLSTQPALLRQGQFYWLGGEQRLQHDDILLCGQAAFQVVLSENRLKLLRKWLWLPTQRIVHWSPTELAGGCRLFPLHTEHTEAYLLFPSQPGHTITEVQGSCPGITIDQSTEEESEE
ncbi:MAG: hypothetical protein CL920_19315 [Deltaproteobacteria bacterium]|nr:hypothetical protein [Deltaproteobacteria bacterium]MBU50837.1 hypothetical protein [Deltaproteobacteria bacterium]